MARGVHAAVGMAKGETMKRLILAAMLVCMVSPAWASDSKGDHMVLGSGARSCGSWVKERKIKDGLISFTYQNWVLGFVTSYNVFTPGIRNVAKGTDANGLMAWALSR